jgi:MerR family transcriptional regulator, copper efflux regulator
VRITEAAKRLGITPRMLRYRESLGLIPALRYRRTLPSRQPGHRQFTQADVAAAALGLSIERRYDISPVALAFAIRVLADPRVRTDVAELGRRVGLIQPPPARALAFEQERAQRLLNLQRPARAD